jgi:AMMECR1 domain-containing protein
MKLSIISILHTFNIYYNEDLPKIPGNYFGVFVTISDNNNIHGCMGSYSKTFESIDIYKDLLKSSTNAAYKDSRSIGKQWHANTEFKVSLMRDPEPLPDDVPEIFPKDTGIIFINDETTATYLPNVFEDITTSDIKKSLMKKASSTKPGSFFIYKTDEDSSMIYDIFIKSVIDESLIPLIKFFNRESKRIPHTIEDHSCNIIKENLNDQVRNISTLLTMYSLTNNEDLVKTICTYIEKNKLSTQAKIFLFMNDKTNSIPCIDKGLIDEMNPNSAEVSFELSEMLTMFSMNNKPIPEDSIKTLEDYIEEHMNKHMNDHNIIFTINWYTQFVFESGSSLKYKDQTLSLINNLLKDHKSLETNYLAVIFECLCYMRCLVESQIIRDYITRTYIYLNERRTSCGTFAFFNGKSRIDITIHVINGLERFRERSCSKKNG